MKTMLFKTRTEHLENIINEIFASKLYEHPHIDFILVKKINGKDYYAAGVSDKINPHEAFLFRPKARSKSIPIQNIRYDKQKCRDLFDECIEGYVLQQMQKGYKIIYMSIGFHITLWEFIDNFYHSIEYFDDGLIYYMSFCYEIGLTSTFLSHYSCGYFPDFIHDFLDEVTFESSKELAETIIESNNRMITSLELRNELCYKIIDGRTEDEERS